MIAQALSKPLPPRTRSPPNSRAAAWAASPAGTDEGTTRMRTSDQSVSDIMTRGREGERRATSSSTEETERATRMINGVSVSKRAVR